MPRRTNQVFGTCLLASAFALVGSDTASADRREDPNKHEVNLGQRSYNYDFGPERSDLMEGWTPVTHKAHGDIYWSGEARALRSIKVKPRDGVNNANRDFVMSMKPVQFNHKIADGKWRITMNMGDLRRAHDKMGVKVEGEVISTNINSIRGLFPYVSRDGGSTDPASFVVEVEDGELNIELFDAGGVDRYWVLTRLSLHRVD